MKTRTGRHVEQTIQQSAPQMQPHRPAPRPAFVRNVNVASREALAAHGATKKENDGR